MLGGAPTPERCVFLKTLSLELVCILRLAPVVGGGCIVVVVAFTPQLAPVAVGGCVDVAVTIAGVCLRRGELASKVVPLGHYRQVHLLELP